MFYQVTRPPPSPNGTVPRSSSNNPPSAGEDNKTRSGKGLVQGPLGERKEKTLSLEDPPLNTSATSWLSGPG